MSNVVVGSRLYLVLDEDLLLIVEPNRARLNWGWVRCACPVEQVDCVSDRQDAKTLHVSALAHRPIGLMRRGPPESSRDGLSAWYAALGLEPSHCRLAEHHLERNRLRVRTEQMVAVGVRLEEAAVATERSVV